MHMQIFHYTSIQTLALILASKKIRFTPLSRLECTQEDSGLPEYVTRGIYVSCWTTEKNESLAQWRLYTGTSGVRIELPKKLYNDYDIQSTPAASDEEKGFRVKYPFSTEQLSTRDYHIAVNVFYENGFFIKMTYDENFRKSKRDGVLKEGEYLKIINPETLAAYKNPIWKFQDEGRFYLTIIPRKEEYPAYVDMDLNEEVLNNINVRLHPNCDPADRLIVEALLDKYTLNGRTEDSEMKKGLSK